MRPRNMIAAFCVVVFTVGLVGCGGGGGSLADLTAMKSKLESAGFSCDVPKPPESEDDDISFGLAEPVEELDCSIDGVEISAIRWNKRSELQVAMGFIESLSCGFGEADMSFVVGETWAVGVDDDSENEADVSATNNALDKAGKALGVKPTKLECDEDSSDDASSDFFDDNETSEAPSTTATGPGSRNDPLAVGESATAGDWEVTVTKITPDATEALLKDDEYADEPENDQFMEIQLDATYRGDDETSPGMSLEVVLSGSDKVQYSDMDCWATSGDSGSQTLEPGGAASMTVCLDVPSAAVDGGLVFVEDVMTWSDTPARAFWKIP